MQIFNYDPSTGQYLSCGNADPDPMQPGEWLLPAFSTAIAPPTVGAGQVAVFDVTSQTWGLVELPPAPPPAPVPPALDAAAEARCVRDLLLDATDWRRLRALDQGTEFPEAWRAYRQALRDVPQQEGFPAAIVWPQEPAV